MTYSCEDTMPSFREAIPNAEAMDDYGAKALATAIVLRAAEDYHKVCLHPDDLMQKEKQPFSKKELEEFIDSDYYEMLTSVDRNVFREKIKELKREGRKFPGKTDLLDKKPKTKPISEMAEYSERISKRHRNHCRKVS